MVTAAGRHTDAGQNRVAAVLAEDPKQRLRDIGDVRLALEGAGGTAAPPALTPATSSKPRGRLAWMAARNRTRRARRAGGVVPEDQGPSSSC